MSLTVVHVCVCVCVCMCVCVEVRTSTNEYLFEYMRVQHLVKQQQQQPHHHHQHRLTYPPRFTLVLDRLFRVGDGAFNVVDRVLDIILDPVDYLTL